MKKIKILPALLLLTGSLVSCNGAKDEEAPTIRYRFHEETFKKFIRMDPVQFDRLSTSGQLLNFFTFKDNKNNEKHLRNNVRFLITENKVEETKEGEEAKEIDPEIYKFLDIYCKDSSGNEAHERIEIKYYKMYLDDKKLLDYSGLINIDDEILLTSDDEDIGYIDNHSSLNHPGIVADIIKTRDPNFTNIQYDDFLRYQNYKRSYPKGTYNIRYALTTEDEETQKELKHSVTAKVVESKYFSLFKNAKIEMVSEGVYKTGQFFIKLKNWFKGVFTKFDFDCFISDEEWNDRFTN